MTVHSYRVRHSLRKNSVVKPCELGHSHAAKSSDTTIISQFLAVGMTIDLALESRIREMIHCCMHLPPF